MEPYLRDMPGVLDIDEEDAINAIIAKHLPSLRTRYGIPRQDPKFLMMADLDRISPNLEYWEPIITVITSYQLTDFPTTLDGVRVHLQFGELTVTPY